MKKLLMAQIGDGGGRDAGTRLATQREIAL
jgi:hypothetical protein